MSLHRMPFGAEPAGEAALRFRLWAPAQKNVELVIDERRMGLQEEDGGWHSLVAEAAVGTRYRYRLADGQLVPDPASRWQPEGVHGASAVVDPLAYAWQDQGWRGRPWPECVLYELHVGTFSSEGTFAAVEAHLDHLLQLGVNTLQLMPLAEFPGRRGWGYDGTLPFAPKSAYGPPEALKHLIDAAHGRGLAMLLDVVYNHFGPEGNYLGGYAPQFFNERHRTPWGAALNFDAAGSRVVRDFFIHNALYWLEEYHFDGLRFDAVHAIADDSEPHILEEIARRIRARDWGRSIYLLLENENNEPRWLQRGPNGQPQLFDAQWNDDVHHVLHVAATGERDGYYAEYHDDGSRLGRALAEGFAFQGEQMAYRGGARGAPSRHLPPCAFLSFLQNHDQVGNRAFGDRLVTLAPPAALRAVTALYLLLPEIPMLFMGEEWGSTHPFLFFSQFGAQLADKVRDGRRAEFARFPSFRDEAVRARIPDPQSEAAFTTSKLDWVALTDASHAAILRWYRELLAARRRHIVPLLAHLERGGRWHSLAPGATSVRWRTPEGSELCLAANLRATATAGFPITEGRLLWQQGRPGSGDMLAAWSVRWVLRS